MNYRTVNKDKIMISIKRYLEPRDSVAAEADVPETLLQVIRLLMEAMAKHLVRWDEACSEAFGRTMEGLITQVSAPAGPMRLLSLGSNAVDAFAKHCRQANDYLRAERAEKQSMVAMLTETVAELSGHSDVAVGRLQAIEEQIERASAIDDIRALRLSLAESLTFLRETAAQERSRSRAAVERLRRQLAQPNKPVPAPVSEERVERAPDLDLIIEAGEIPPQSISATYVAAFRLQRADHIARRFGDSVRHQMLSVVAAHLNAVIGADDHLCRWRGTSFVMFLKTNRSIQDVRDDMRAIVSSVGQRYIEVGRNSALLSVGLDWIVFPHAQGTPLERVFGEVDAFLGNTRGTVEPRRR